MRLSLFAVAALLAVIVGVPSVEAHPYKGYNSHRIERTHAKWSGKQRYSNRGYSQRRGHRYASHSYRGSYGRRVINQNSRYAHRQGVSRRYAQRHTGRRYASAGVGGRPRAWCGWWMRTQLGGGPEYNLAANWRRYGRSSGPQVGAVVVWPHHVGIITGRASNGQWIVKSGNDGNAVRERARSVAGAVFRVG
ncbi:hypothetical protein Hden_3298 [Hyphomicrobium denitrificans ATCC 51888]|uniref:Peptidase C51 domain-containing protein n=1 Tax=Hyphomicrobium denitrificans (strain ATCC 51888 / DSM 1869 / NCIMB 11706 / TK 0415) TaxID=582899 RepID=D8JWY3_HYPDA|nr:hypothetical protein [Hyphomicrobium denitrificans]ADJ25091.1 hypothetical protein Hden_3298 [Hyphomicrobium denitrificans ATCC 51888]